MSLLQRAVRQLRWSVELRGVGGTAALATRRLLGMEHGHRQPERPVHPFDIEHGVETGGRIGGSHLGVGHSHDVYNVAYQGAPPSRLRHAVELWRAVPGTRPIGDYAFFDVGCGKGRVVMLASELGFREVGGVELDPALAGIGQNNLIEWAKTGKAKCPVTITQGDATEVPLPDLPCVLFMYNPFRGPVVAKMLARLEQHVGDRVSELDVIYLVPNEAAEFAAFPKFKKMWEGVAVMSEEDQRWDDSDVEDAAQVWRR